MKKSFLAIILLFSILCSCQTEKKVSEKQEYLRWVGDIEQNDQIDELDFKVCNGDDKVLQYFNLGEGPVYSGEKSKILNTFKSSYKPISDKKENGLIRIRFIVNCEGKAGRFRVLQSDYDYQEKEFDKKIISQLLNITKEIETWEVIRRNEVPVDYYMYMIFKINDGQLTEILP
ncbi:hypothetical protein HZY62_14390 [Maribacter polysiphoniae]|uniref:TonB-like protein n=1 Tax=Maribacter polysiphoniae TaxID=429344 RepID=A0A316DFR5_9FLAO|nr:hypothetical protein [Maribacter polysiphoniae]MBD1261791.1 hypothetical protein [Maribacter polysiphoniae]PWK17051.1 hypothetical protein LX92_04471 [Maribacter polysiphoniae]